MANEAQRLYQDIRLSTSASAHLGDSTTTINGNVFVIHTNDTSHSCPSLSCHHLIQSLSSSFTRDCGDGRTGSIPDFHRVSVSPVPREYAPRSFSIKSQEMQSKAGDLAQRDATGIGWAMAEFEAWFRCRQKRFLSIEVDPDWESDTTTLMASNLYSVSKVPTLIYLYDRLNSKSEETEFDDMIEALEYQVLRYLPSVMPERDLVSTKKVRFYDSQQTGDDIDGARRLAMLLQMAVQATGCLLLIIDGFEDMAFNSPAAASQCEHFLRLLQELTLHDSGKNFRLASVNWNISGCFDPDPYSHEIDYVGID